MKQSLLYDKVLAAGIFSVFMWIVFMGTSARTCQLRHLGDWLDKTPVADFPLSILLAIPGICLIVLSFWRRLRARQVGQAE